MIARARGVSATALLCPLAVAAAAMTQEAPRPPEARVVPKRLEAHGDVRIDNLDFPTNGERGVHGDPARSNSLGD
ncbi:hypothetical protein [Tautonia marina]|uniref:hypothetical protein n=1 Tax=Tautonia marina TaxID=2653855 RepID=UPI001260AB8B|nr:hypothetical protein [Tautonia marina]